MQNPKAEFDVGAMLACYDRDALEFHRANSMIRRRIDETNRRIARFTQTTKVKINAG